MCGGGTYNTPVKPVTMRMVLHFRPEDQSIGFSASGAASQSTRIGSSLSFDFSGATASTLFAAAG